jgi:hypothetical protein
VRRFLAIALGGLLVLLLLTAAAVRYDVLDPPSHPDISPAPIGPAGWKVTRRYSLNRVLIIEGECRERARAREIAESIVDVSSEAYDEVLIYVRPPGERLHARRVQWTKAGGYQLLDY